MKRTDPYIRVQGPAWGGNSTGNGCKQPPMLKPFGKERRIVRLLSELWRKRNEASHIW
jgi:hypothetical protein